MKKKASKSAKQRWALAIIIAFVVAMLAIATYVTVDVISKQQATPNRLDSQFTDRYT